MLTLLLVLLCFVQLITDGSVLPERSLQDDLESLLLLLLSQSCLHILVVGLSFLLDFSSFAIFADNCA